MEVTQEYIKFHNGYKMPAIGLGTWQSSKEEIQAAVNAALESGYRHIDTAFNYQNEDAIGEVLHQWIQSGKIKREDLFIVTKLPMTANRKEDVERLLRKSLTNLKLDYLDLYLIHAPVGLIGKDDDDIFPRDEKGYVILDLATDLVTLWQGMENQVDAGLTRSIGISNFNPKQIERIVKNARIKPANLQVELHAQFQQKELRELCNKHKITICAYAPLGSPGRQALFSFYGIEAQKVIPDLLNHPVVTRIANKHRKSNAQVLLRFLVQLGVAVIPKSVTPSRIEDNFQIFDFKLTPVDMGQLYGLDLGEKGRSFKFAGVFKGAEKHPENPYAA